MHDLYALLVHIGSGKLQVKVQLLYSFTRFHKQDYCVIPVYFVISRRILACCKGYVEFIVLNILANNKVFSGLCCAALSEKKKLSTA